MKTIIARTALITLAVVLIYGGYWIAKNVSYFVFYEDMVIETIKETIKPEYLK